jgi:ArsR family transcriptional regulator
MPAIPRRQLALLRCMGDRKRLKILLVLRKGDLCVCDIVRALKVEQSLISHHLQLLRKCGLVRCTKEGRKIKYSLAGAQIAELLEKVDEVSRRLQVQTV